MQSSNPVRIRCIRVCPILQQKNCELLPAAGGRHYQSGSVLRSCLVNIRSSRQQTPCGGHIPLLARKQQRRETALRTCANIRSALNQRPYDFWMFLGNCPHQSGVPLLGLLRIRIRPVGQQQFHRFHVSRARTHHERRFPGPLGRVGIRSGLQ